VVAERKVSFYGCALVSRLVPVIQLTSLTVFVGNTAAISFLQFLQKTLERHIGPSGFTNAQESQRLFEADAIDSGSSHFYDRLCAEDKQAYIQNFFDVVGRVFPLCYLAKFSAVKWPS
jgi:hypothetical protein